MVSLRQPQRVGSEGGVRLTSLALACLSEAPFRTVVTLNYGEEVARVLGSPLGIPPSSSLLVLFLPAWIVLFCLFVFLLLFLLFLLLVLGHSPLFLSVAKVLFDSWWLFPSLEPSLFLLFPFAVASVALYLCEFWNTSSPFSASSLALSC